MTSKQEKIIDLIVEATKELSTRLDLLPAVVIKSATTAIVVSGEIAEDPGRQAEAEDAWLSSQRQARVFKAEITKLCDFLVNEFSAEMDANKERSYSDPDETTVDCAIRILKSFKEAKKEPSNE